MDDGDHLDEGVGEDGEGVDGGALVVAPARQLPCVLIHHSCNTILVCLLFHLSIISIISILL